MELQKEESGRPGMGGPGLADIGWFGGSFQAWMQAFTPVGASAVCNGSGRARISAQKW